MKTTGTEMGSKQIKAFRTSLGLTQQQLAERLGVSQESVSQWEGGKKKPSRPVLMLFLRLKTDISDFAKNN